jgi:hypothetical protein
MNVKFEYEKPLFVDLSEESAVGTTCADYGNNASDFYCNAGSCPPLSQCATGTRAQTCYVYGYTACNPSSNTKCYSCCQTGNSVYSGLTKCWCDYGGTTGFTCITGNKADGSGDCSTGGYYDWCY